MSTEESRLVEYLGQLPPGTNPYLAAAKIVDNFLQLPKPPTYSTILTAFSIVTYLLMCLQVGFLYHQRLSLAKFSKSPALRFNKVGIVVIEASVLSVYCYGIYAIITLIYLLMELSLPHRIADEATRYIVYSYKFLVVLTSSWLFLWNCAGQCALLIWESDFASRMQRERLQSALKWGLNTFFLVVAFAPWPAILWTFGVGYKDFFAIESTLNETQAALVSAASKYDPKTYNTMDLLLYLIPAKKALSYMNDLESRTLFGIKIYSVALTLLAIVYIPLLSFSLIGLYRGAFSKVNAGNSDDRSRKTESFAMVPHIRKKIYTLVYHALWVYISTLVHLPILLWCLCNSPPGYIRESTHRAVLNHGLTLPFSISGNIALSILIVNTRNSLRDITQGGQHISLEACSKGSAGSDQVILSRTGQKEFASLSES